MVLSAFRHEAVKPQRVGRQQEAAVHGSMAAAGPTTMTNNVMQVKYIGSSIEIAARQQRSRGAGAASVEAQPRPRRRVHSLGHARCCALPAVCTQPKLLAYVQTAGISSVLSFLPSLVPLHVVLAIGLVVVEAASAERLLLLLQALPLPASLLPPTSLPPSWRVPRLPKRSFIVS